MLVDSTSIPLRNLQSSPPASCHVNALNYLWVWTVERGRLGAEIIHLKKPLFLYIS